VPPYLDDTPGVRQDIAMFHGAIRRLDDAVGTILSALVRNGLQERTVVVFTTDHGIAFPRAKATLYDPGIQTALVLRWPGGTAGGQTIDEMVSNIDLLPSLLEGLGIATPGPVQGRSFWQLLSGGGYDSRAEIFAEKSTTPEDVKRCVRTATHKLIRNYNEGPQLELPTDIEASLTRRDMGDAHLAPRPQVELYDLVDDPLEVRNLAGAPEVADVERGLVERLDQFLEETGDPVLRGPIPRPPEEAELIARARSRVRRAT